MTIDMALATARARFQRWFHDMGLSQAEFADFVGCDAALVSKLLSGERQRVGLETAVLIEQRSKAWEHGPILPSEWIDVSESAA